MVRLTLKEETEAELREIQWASPYLRRERALDNTIKFVIKEFKTKKEVEKQLAEFREEILSTVRDEVKTGVTEALTQWIANILSLGRRE
jgi:predicted Holliday junction resolvase-like endonuclease